MLIAHVGRLEIIMVCLFLILKFFFDYYFYLYFKIHFFFFFEIKKNIVDQDKFQIHQNFLLGKLEIDWHLFYNLKKLELEWVNKNFIFFVFLKN